MLKQVFAKIIESGLTLKCSKCNFGSDHIIFLGHLVSQQGIGPDPKKLEAFLAMPPTKDASGVRRILEAFGYYRKFILQFSSIAEPLIKLTRKNVVFEWGLDQQKAFQGLKDALAANETLAHINTTDPVVLKTDASITGVAGVLLQQQEGQWRLITCVSRALTLAEKNYSPIELEALAIVYSLSKLRHFLLGRHFKILTDHCALCVLNRKSPQNARVARWALDLSE